MSTATGNMAEYYTENSNCLQGDKSPRAKPISYNGKERIDIQKKIAQLAAQDGTTEKQLTVNILNNLTSQLVPYIRAHGETPVQTANGIALQAALLRANDIATIARSANISDADALNEIETAETEATQLNTGEADEVLPLMAQAALLNVIDELHNQFSGNFGCRNLSDTMGLVKKSGQATPLEDAKNQNISKADNFDLGSIIDVSNPPFQQDLAGGGTTTNPTTNNSSDNSSSIWDLIGNITKAAGQVSTAIKQVGQAAQTTVNTSSANAINNYVKTNWLQLLLIVAAIIAVIILLVHATKNK